MIIFGRQGAGKGTQSSHLAEHFGVPHISTGDMLRASAATGSEFGQTVKAIMDVGGLVPDEMMDGVVRERLAMPDAAIGFLLDGYPRTQPQAEFLKSILAPEAIDLTINLEVPEEVVVERITHRRVCESCRTIYAVGDESADSGVCVKCKGSVVQRADDTEESVRKRLATYRAETEPLMAWFKDHETPLLVVDGVGTPDEVADALVASIEAAR